MSPSFFGLLLVLGVQAVWTSYPSIIVSMICRNEEVNIRANLGAWATFADYFVFLLDDRTSDNTQSAIEVILDENKKSYYIQNYTFNGFGSARTQGLHLANKHYPNASVIMIADPDWRPILSTISKQDLIHTEDIEVYRFNVLDRNGVSRRKMDWMLANRPNLKMKYNLHEALDIGYYTKIKSLSWVFEEIEQPGTWHSIVGHNHSMSHKRYEFDLQLLYAEYLNIPFSDIEKRLSASSKLPGKHDPHLHYYLGVTHHAHLERIYNENKTVSYEELDLAIYFLKKRAFDYYPDEFVEQRYSSLLLLGSIHSTFLNEYLPAVQYLQLCQRVINKHVSIECVLQLINVHLANGQIESAMRELQLMLKTVFVDRMMMNTLHAKTCQLPDLMLKVYYLYYTHSRGTSLSLGDALYMLVMLKSMDFNQQQNICVGDFNKYRGLYIKTIQKALDQYSMLKALDGGKQNI